MENKKKLFNYAVRLLARRRYHSSELKKKIILRTEKYKMEMENGNNINEEVEDIIESLKKVKYLNDEEYFELYVRDQLQRKPQGMRLIRQRLMQKRLPKEDIEENLRKNLYNEDEQAKLAIEKKIKTLKVTTPRQQKEKLFRFLASRGFTGKTISDCMKKYF